MGIHTFFFNEGTYTFFSIVWSDLFWVQIRVLINIYKKRREFPEFVHHDKRDIKASELRNVQWQPLKSWRPMSFPDRTGDLPPPQDGMDASPQFFPHLTNYETFMKTSSKAVGFIAALPEAQLCLNQENSNEYTQFLDSACGDKYISSYRAAKATASRGKSKKGWPCGF